MGYQDCFNERTIGLLLLSSMDEKKKIDIVKNCKDGYFLHLLSNDDNVRVRCEVARNSKTELYTLDNLSRDEEFLVRAAVAAHTLDYNLLDKLSRDKYYKVRVAVADNDNVTFDILNALSDDLSFDVIEKIAKNPNASSDTLKKVYDRLFNYFNEHYGYLINYVLSDIYRNINCPVCLMEYYSLDEGHIVEKIIFAANENLTESAANKLASYHIKNIDLELAANKKVRGDVLSKLFDYYKDPDNYDRKIMECLAANPNTDESILKELINDYNLSLLVLSNPGVSEDLLWGEMEYKNDNLNEVIAKNPNATSDMLTELSERPNAFVRANVALNPNCPDDVLKKLAYDHFDKVRMNAALNPNIKVQELLFMASGNGDDKQVADEKLIELASKEDE